MQRGEERTALRRDGAGQLDCDDLIKESFTRWDSHMGEPSYQIWQNFSQW